jgi:DNA-binding transcriptional MerR regulator
MPIEQMRRYCALRAEGTVSAAELQDLLGAHLAELHRRRAELQGHIQYVERKIAYWRAIEEQDDQAAAQIAREVDTLVRATVAARG